MHYARTAAAAVQGRRHGSGSGRGAAGASAAAMLPVTDPPKRVTDIHRIGQHLTTTALNKR